MAASPLVTAGDEDGDPRPLRLAGSALYLDRYWREERQVAADLRELRAGRPGGVDGERLADGLRRLFADGVQERQRAAAEAAVLGRLTLVAGGPGTGKTTTVARIAALLAEQGPPEPLVALAAPTGKAAARLAEAVHEQAPALAVGDDVRAWLGELPATTLHRLLGRDPGSHTRFRHHRGNRLPHDVVVVDETSMVSLSLMARLVEAVRPDARLVLVGDPAQLTSIEAGAVLGDLVRPGGDGIVVLDRDYRSSAPIARVGAAVRRGDGDAVVEALSAGGDAVTWIPVDPGHAALEDLEASAAAGARAVARAAHAGDAAEAIAALGAFRVLCAHRRGPYGVATWAARIEARLARLEGEWYAGRPLLATANDYSIGLFNSDTGVVVAHADGLVAAFERTGRVLEIPPSRLSAVETVYAMTVHKSQGSQFDTAAVVVPPPGSRLLTRELLYTAVTRARTRLIVAGTEEAVRAAVARPVARASGLTL